MVAGAYGKYKASFNDDLGITSYSCDEVWTTSDGLHASATAFYLTTPDQYEDRATNTTQIRAK